MREGLEQITIEREDIYRCRSLEGLRSPNLVTPVMEDNRITLEAEIEQAVRDLKRGRAGGLYSMQT